MKGKIEDLLTPLASTLSAADLPSDDLRWIAEHLGIETAIKVALLYPGMTIYIPKSCERRLKMVYLAKNHTGNNLRDLCVKLNISQTTALRWLRAARGTIEPKQLGLFDADTHSSDNRK